MSNTDAAPCNLLKGTMSHLQGPKNEKVKFQRQLKDNTNSELP